MYSLDQSLFMALNFDGGAVIDRVMLLLSAVWPWLWLYALVLYMVARREGWRRMLLFLVLMVVAIVLADMVAGAFKHNGFLEGLLPDFRPRLRPMFTPELEGLAITPDSLYLLRQSGAAGDWAVHVPVEAVVGRYGTVSAHAATMVTLTLMAARVIRRRWVTWLLIISTLVICYSRIYLAKHFPIDLMWGALVGLLLGLAAERIYRLLGRRL